jgi:hypothetical protein
LSTTSVQTINLKHVIVSPIVFLQVIKQAVVVISSLALMRTHRATFTQTNADVRGGCGFCLR